MKNKHVWFAVALLPMLLLVSIVVARKKRYQTVSGISVTSGTSGNALVVDRVAIGSAQTIFENREFTDVKDERSIRDALADRLSRLMLDPKQRDEASKCCWGMIKAYGTSDWDLFISTRVPALGYEVPPGVVKFMESLLPNHRETDASALYREIWEHNFKGTPFFTMISLQTNAINLETMGKESMGGLTFAKIGVQKGQLFVDSGAKTVFDYTKKAFSARGVAAVLSLSFYAKMGEAVSPIMIAFAWNDQDSTWLPIKMKEGLASKPIARVYCF